MSSQREIDLELLEAAVASDWDAAIELLRQGAEIGLRDRAGRTAFLDACADGCLEFVSLGLAASGANAKDRDSAGWTGLHFAAQEYHPAIAKLLIQHSADVNAQNAHRNTPLHVAVSHSQGRSELIRLLLKSGASQDIENCAGLTVRAIVKSMGLPLLES